MAENNSDELQVSILCSSGSSPVSQNALVISFSADYNRKQLPAELEQNIGKVWAERCSKNPTIWNGSKFRLHSIATTQDGRQQWNLGLTCYRDFLGTNFSPSADTLQQLGRDIYNNSQAFMSDPLGVGALLLTSDNHVVVLKRSTTCAEAPGLYDIPGGHPEPAELAGDVDIGDMDLSLFTPEAIRGEVYMSVLREVRDEVNVPLASLSDPLLLGIALNKSSHGRASSEYLIRVELTGAEVVDLYNTGSQAEADETTAIRLLTPAEVQRIRESDLWSTLAPSARGCFLLYHEYRQHSAAQS